MGIYRNLKIIHIHIPKNCGSTIRILLDKYDKVIFPMNQAHSSYLTYKSYIENILKENINDYFIFTVIRNLYSRVLSIYNYSKRQEAKHAISFNNLMIGY